MTSELRPGVSRCGNLLSRSPRMREVFDLVARIAEVDCTVLIQGEMGTGKAEVARAIHQASAPRRPGPFVAVNCQHLPEALVEYELFGHVKGVFARPGKVKRPGAFENARGGTLFLRHVEHVPPGAQQRLLYALQERRVTPVGDDVPVEVDVRVVASAVRGLARLAAARQFREDLYYRLNVVRIDLPPLRERPEDVPLLAAHFAAKFTGPDRVPAELTPAAVEALLRQAWPGNMRELESVLERACLLAGGGPVRPEHMAPG